MTHIPRDDIPRDVHSTGRTFHVTKIPREVNSTGRKFHVKFIPREVHSAWSSFHVKFFKSGPPNPIEEKKKKKKYYKHINTIPGLTKSH